MRISELEYSNLNISNEDVFEAMKKIPGYLDITPKDFLELYHEAYQHALGRLKSAIKAEHIMTASVVTIDENKPLADAAQLMANFNISGLPVIDSQGQVSGVISDKDFLKHMNITEKTSIESDSFFLSNRFPLLSSKTKKSPYASVSVSSIRRRSQCSRDSSFSLQIFLISESKSFNIIHLRIEAITSY